MKRTLVLCMAVLLCVIPCASLAGALPGLNTLYGEYMPSPAFAIDRAASSTQTVGEDKVETYTPFTDADYDKWGGYLKAWGCTLGTEKVEGSVITIPVKNGASTITFAYDRAQHTAAVTYPKGTRPETEGKTVTGNEASILPVLRIAFGVEMPSFAVSFGKKAASDEEKNGMITEKYANVQEEDYTAFGAYAAGFGCALKGYSYENGIVTCTLQKDGAAFTFAYDHMNAAATLTYPADTYITKSTEKKTAASVLPAVDSLYGVYLPTAVTALKRQPDAERMTAENATEQVFDHFDDDAYNTYSTFIMQAGCTVAGYTVEGAVMDIKLEKDGLQFTFIYDRENSKATFIYPAGTRPEKVVLATATPLPTATPVKTATPKPTATTAPKNYTAQECHDIAIRYIKNRLKNPQSFQEHSYRYSTNNGSYTFYIDYSAMNGFGGYNRETYCIEVNYSTGRVMRGYSF